jgi:hypothetical protein
MSYVIQVKFFVAAKLGRSIGRSVGRPRAMNQKLISVDDASFLYTFEADSRRPLKSKHYLLEGISPLALIPIT